MKNHLKTKIGGQSFEIAAGIFFAFEVMSKAFDAMTADSEIWDNATSFPKKEAMVGELRDGVVDHPPTRQYAAPMTRRTRPS